MSNRLGGFQGTSYLGTNANQPPNITFHTDNPTQYDTQNYSLGDMWVNTANLTVWCLVSLAGDSTSKGQLAIWISMGGGGGGNTNYITDAGTATETGGNINILGGPNINTSGSSSTVDINLNQNLVGLGQVEIDDLVVNNSAEFSFLTEGVVYANSSGELTISNGNDGEVLIGSTAGVPLWRNITAGSNVTIVNGSNSIEISSTGGGGGGGPSVLGSGANGTLASDATQLYMPLFSSGLPSGLPFTGSAIPVAGTINKLYVSVYNNISGVDVDVTLNVNGVDTGLTVTIPAGTTGEFSDLVNTVSVSAGDNVLFHSTQSTVNPIGGSLTAAFSTGGGSNGAWVLLATKTATAQPDLEFTSEISPAYDNYVLKYDKATFGPVVGTDFMQIQLSIDSGATYITSGYVVTSGSDPGTGMIFMTHATALSVITGCGMVHLLNFTAASNMPMIGGPLCPAFITPGNTSQANGGYGIYPNATAVNAFRIVITDGSDFSGTFSLYGIIS